MPSSPSQILLFSDNARIVASLEGALGADRAGAAGPGGPVRGQFRLHRLTRPEQLEQRLVDPLTVVDGAIVDGTAPCFSNDQLQQVLLALDRHQLGTVLLTPPQVQLGAAAAVPANDSLPLVWPLPTSQLDALPATLDIIRGYQQVVRQFQREMRLFQRLDSQISGQLGEIDQEMRLASRIQRDFLPKKLPAIGRALFATLYRPASWVSGDLYDVFRLDETHIGFYIADAVGHGMPAALLTMFIKRAIETKHVNGNGYRLLGPDETLRLLNRALLDASLSNNQFTTAIYAVLAIDSLQLQFARGGHPHPIWLHANGKTSEPNADGGLLGVFPDAQFACQTLQLSPGDKFILYSDGLEMTFVEGEQMVSRLYRDHIESVRALPIDEALLRLTDRMDSQAGSLNPRDDVTLVGLEIRGG